MVNISVLVSSDFILNFSQAHVNSRRLDSSLIDTSESGISFLNGSGASKSTKCVTTSRYNSHGAAIDYLIVDL